MRCIHTPLLIAKKRKYRNKPRVAVRGQRTEQVCEGSGSGDDGVGWESLSQRLPGLFLGKGEHGLCNAV